MQQINISELKPHPRNNEFFDDMTGEKWNEFLESVRTSGVIEPIVITTDMVIVSGHQRVRALKELGIDTVMCEIKSYTNEDSIIKDLLETNIRQRGDVGGSAKKVGLRIKELERLYGIQHGGNHGNQYIEAKPNNSELAKSQDDIASQFGISVDTLQNYKLLADMIPELEELLDTGVVTKTTALAMMKELSEQEQTELISSLDTTKRITKREVEQYIAKIKELEMENSSTKVLKTQLSELKTEKSILERKIKLNQEEADKYNKLKSEVDFLTKQKKNLGRQIDSATELAGLTVRLQKVLETELAPIKFKRCMEELDSSDVCVENLTDIITRIDDWSYEMKKFLNNNDYVVADIQ